MFCFAILAVSQLNESMTTVSDIFKFSGYPKQRSDAKSPLPRQTLGRAMDQGLGNVEGQFVAFFFQLYEFLDELALVFLRTFEDFDEAFEHVA